MVIVRGEVTTYQEAPQLPTYESLRDENQRLRQNIEALKTGLHPTPRLSQVEEASETTTETAHPLGPQRFADQDDDGFEQRLWDTISSTSDIRDIKSTVSSWEDITLPSRECSERLIAYDEMWNSWAHYAVEYPQFSYECDRFMEAVERGTKLGQADASWMAVYFSVLSVPPPPA